MTVPQRDQTCDLSLTSTHLQTEKQPTIKEVQIPIQMSAFLSATHQPINSTTLSSSTPFLKF